METKSAAQELDELIDDMMLAWGMRPETAGQRLDGLIRKGATVEALAVAFNRTETRRLENGKEALADPFSYMVAVLQQAAQKPAAMRSVGQVLGRAEPVQGMIHRETYEPGEPAGHLWVCAIGEKEVGSS